MTNKSKLCVILLSIIQITVSLNVLGQSKKDWYIEPTINVGNAVPSGEKYRFLRDQRSVMFGFNIGKQTHGESEWQQYTNYPDIGLGFKFGTFFPDTLPRKDSADVLGSFISSYIYINGRIYETDRFAFTYSLGMGPSYWFICHDDEKYKYNTQIGSHINVFLNGELGALYKISNRADITLNAAVSHSSNGSLKLPNRGINVVSCRIGYRYHFREKTPNIKTIDSTTVFHKSNGIHLYYAPAVSESREVYGSYYFANTLQVGYTRQFHPLFRYGAGLDLFYNSGLETKLEPEDRSQSKYWSSGVYVSAELLYDRMAILFAYGLYTYRGFEFNTPYYERAGVYYTIDKKRQHSIGIAMKVHKGTIEYIEWAYKYQFIGWQDAKGKHLW